MSKDANVSGEAVAAFVHTFHANLTEWFAGTGDRSTVWTRLTEATPTDMTLVYPSGAKLSGARFLESIRDLFGRSPGFVASISDLEVIRIDVDSAVVAYVEEQTGAKQSQARNRRSALALLVRSSGTWRWRYIQETALPEAC